MNEMLLHQRLVEELGRKSIDRTEIPSFILSNLRKGYGERTYQKSAFRYFLSYWNESFEGKPGSNHQLLFHMATGSGKTVIMAGLILYLYEQGYRNFLFFVHSSNIIDKTRDNFLNPSSAKHLFADAISIAGKQVRIQEVENFQVENEDDIHIVFSTIQSLHSRLNAPRENSLTYEDFEERKIVLISDEAHHINADTKKGKRRMQTKMNLKVGSINPADEESESESWESTVNRIFYANPANILLEFTATVDLTTPEIARKYNDKLIFDYSLKQFRKDGYSKEVKVLQADLPPFERALQAVLLSQYRLKVFTKHKLRIKPVLLFKSKTIGSSKRFREEFSERIQKLSAADIGRFRNNPYSDSVIKNMFEFFDSSGISPENLIAELTVDFVPEKLISVNSREESEQKQIAVNTLEDEANEYRAVFAVDKLNEGWDVLNLFDIVRLYDTRDAKKGKPGKTTMSEAQLIGRGARYCPFRVEPEQPLTRRKYDTDLANGLRVCEELYYHSAYNPRYIQELNTALEEIGIRPKESREQLLELKEEFKQSDLYKTGLLFLNEKREQGGNNGSGLSDHLREHVFKIALSTGYVRAQLAFGKVENVVVESGMITCDLSSFGQHVLRKAINKLPFFYFSNLSDGKNLPDLKSINEFIQSEKYLAGVRRIEITGLPSQIKNLSDEEKLFIAGKVLEEITVIISSEMTMSCGTTEFRPVALHPKITDKLRNYPVPGESDKEEGKSMSKDSSEEYRLDLQKRSWYAYKDCYGTSEEKLFVKYFDSVVDLILKKYDEVYLIRNERQFKLHSFKDGAAVEPDYVLFLVRKENEIALHYQIFIEPKGQHLLAADKWKEDFMEELQERASVRQVWSGRKYIILGMPFYNENAKVRFDQKFREVLQLSP